MILVDFDKLTMAARLLWDTFACLYFFPSSASTPPSTLSTTSSPSTSSSVASRPSLSHSSISSPFYSPSVAAAAGGPPLPPSTSSTRRSEYENLRPDTKFQIHLQYLLAQAFTEEQLTKRSYQIQPNVSSTSVSSGPSL